MFIGNKDVMFVRVYGRLVPIEKIDFVQVDPNTNNIVQDVPLLEPIEKLMWHNLHNYTKPNQDWRELEEKPEFKLIQNINK
jgi:hypothetical protein